MIHKIYIMNKKKEIVLFINSIFTHPERIYRHLDTHTNFTLSIVYFIECILWGTTNDWYKLLKLNQSLLGSTYQCVFFCWIIYLCSNCHKRVITLFYQEMFAMELIWIVVGWSHKDLIMFVGRCSFYSFFLKRNANFSVRCT